MSFERMRRPGHTPGLQVSSSSRSGGMLILAGGAAGSPGVPGGSTLCTPSRRLCSHCSRRKPPQCAVVLATCELVRPQASSFRPFGRACCGYGGGRGAFGARVGARAVRPWRGSEQGWPRLAEAPSRASRLAPGAERSASAPLRLCASGLTRTLCPAAPRCLRGGARACAAV